MNKKLKASSFCFSGEDDDSSIIENSPPTRFDKIDEKENSLSTNSKSNLLCIDENSNVCTCPNEGKY